MARLTYFCSCCATTVAKKSSILSTNILALVLLGLYFSANRMVEYYIPVAVLAGALNAVPLWKLTDKRLAVSIATSLLVLAGWRIYLGMNLYKDISTSPIDRFQTIAGVLEEQAAPGSIVFNGSTDDFPFLIWQTTNFKFVNGLSSHYLAFQDPQRYLDWMKISGYREPPPDTGRMILESFNANWVVVGIEK